MKYTGIIAIFTGMALIVVLAIVCLYFCVKSILDSKRVAPPKVETPTTVVEQEPTNEEPDFPEIIVDPTAIDPKLITENYSEEQNLFYQAVTSSSDSLEQVKQIKQLVEEGQLNVNSFWMGGRTPLLEAISLQNTDLIAYLVQSGANVKWVDETGMIPLTHAIGMKDAKIVRQLIDLGADVNQTPPNRYPPLWVAVQMNQPEIVKILLKAGADVNATLEIDGRKVSGVSALGLANTMGYTEIQKILKSAGASN